MNAKEKIDFTKADSIQLIKEATREISKEDKDWQWEATVYFFGCSKCGAVCMTTKQPFDDWHECPTCRQMINLHNAKSKTIRIADDGTAWLEMLKEAKE